MLGSYAAAYRLVLRNYTAKCLLKDYSNRLTIASLPD